MSSADDTASATSSRPKYHAVVTYVPEEFLWCDWLHDLLDETVVAPEFLGRRTRHGFARPPRLLIFPDPRNTAHLARQETAVPPCRYLIVVCSPQSARSPALDEQIRLFKRTEGEDRIVVLVVDGDPEQNAARAAGDADWLPAWLRWRLDDHGNFRPGEAAEPLIIDARADRLPLPEVRAQVLAAILDLPRADLRRHHDLLSPAAKAKLFPAKASPAATATKPASAKAGSGGWGWILAAGVVLVLGVAWGMKSMSGPQAGVVAAKATPEPTPVAAPPVAVPAATSAATPHLVAAASNPPATVEPRVALPAPVESVAPPLPTASATPVAPAIDRTAVQVAPPPPVAAATFVPGDGPATPIRSIHSPTSEAAEPAMQGSWQQLRDLGDVLMQRGNREAGLIALSQATEKALKQAGSQGSSPDERIDVARLCFRVGALQRQFFTAAEARRTLEGGVHLLQTADFDADAAPERDSLLASLAHLIESTHRGKPPAEETRRRE